MRDRLKGFANWLRFNVVDVASTCAVVGLGIGFWMAWEPLGIIIPCVIVFALGIAARVIPKERDRKEEDSPDA